MAGARQARGRVGLRVAPIGLEFCGRSLRHRQVHEHQVRMGQTWTLSEVIPHFWRDFMVRQGAGVCSVSRGACVACFDSTTVTGHVLPDICFMVSPSRIVVIAICNVSTHSKNTCQGTVHVRLCSLRAARWVCTRHTLFPSVHSSDPGPHLRLFKKDNVEPCLLFFFLVLQFLCIFYKSIFF